MSRTAKSVQTAARNSGAAMNGSGSAGRARGHRRPATCQGNGGPGRRRRRRRDRSPGHPLLPGEGEQRIDQQRRADEEQQVAPRIEDPQRWPWRLSSHLGTARAGERRLCRQLPDAATSRAFLSSHLVCPLRGELASAPSGVTHVFLPRHGPGPIERTHRRRSASRRIAAILPFTRRRRGARHHARAADYPPSKRKSLGPTKRARLSDARSRF